MSGDVAELDRVVDLQTQGWALTTLGDLFAISTPGHWGDEPDGDGNILVLRSTNFRKAGGLVYETAAPRQFDDRKLVQKRLQRGDIILERSGGSPAQPVGRARRFDVEGCYSVSNFMQIMRAADHVDNWFACYLLDYIYDQGLTETLQKATTGIRNLDFKTYLDLPVSVPPLDEQRRIAEVLRSVDEAISAADAVATAMLRANRTMRHELLKVSPDGTISDLPSDWAVCPLEELASVDRGKFSIRPRNDPRYFGGSTPFIQTGDVTSAGEYITRHTQTLNELGVGVSRVFPAGTIMTTIAANIGDFAIATYPVACPDSVVGIEAEADVEPFWLYSALTCFKVALDRAATQNAQKNINLQTLRPLPIPVPPRALMIELAETLSAAADAARQAKAAVANLMALKQSLLSDLLSGRARVPA